MILFNFFIKKKETLIMKGKVRNNKGTKLHFVGMSDIVTPLSAYNSIMNHPVPAPSPVGGPRLAAAGGKATN